MGGSVLWVWPTVGTASLWEQTLCRCLFPCPLHSESHRWDDEAQMWDIYAHILSYIKPKFM